MKEPGNNAIQLFDDQKIRVTWDVEQEEWYFSVVDVVGVLTDSPDYNTGRKYWNKAAYISDFDRQIAKYLKGGEPN